jgi:hypothetical protein
VTTGQTTEPRATGVFAVLLVASWTAAWFLAGYLLGFAA